MKKYRAFYYVEEQTKEGRKVTRPNESMVCEVRGKDLDEVTIIKRLSNNLKTWQSAGNKCGAFNNAKFFITGFEEVK